MNKKLQQNLLYAGLGLAGLYTLARLGRLRKTPILDPAKMTSGSMVKIDSEGTATLSKNFYRASACIARNEPVKRGLAEQARELAAVLTKAAQGLAQARVIQVRIADNLLPPSVAASDLLRRAEELRALNLDQIQDYIDFVLAELSLAPDCDELDEWNEVDIRALED